MSVKCSVLKLNQNREDFIINNVINKNFGMLEEVINQEIQDIEKLSPYKLNLNENDLDNLEKLIDSFIIPGAQCKNYHQALNFLKNYS